LHKNQDSALDRAAVQGALDLPHLTAAVFLLTMAIAKSKQLHHRRPHDPNQQKSNIWVSRVQLFGETEGLAVTVQDHQVVNTVN